MAIDFSIRNEVELTLEEKLDIEMTEKQIDDVMEAIELNDTFLSVIGLFVTKGIKEIAEKENIPLDHDKLEQELSSNRKFIKAEDL